MGWKHFHCLKYQAQLNLGSKAFAYSNIGKYFSQSKSKFLTFEIKGICDFSVNAGRSSSWCFLGSRTSCLTEHISKQMSTSSQCGTKYGAQQLISTSRMGLWWKHLPCIFTGLEGTMEQPTAGSSVSRTSQFLLFFVNRRLVK